MCFGFCDSDMNTNTSWQPSQNNGGGFLQQQHQEIGGGLSSSVITSSAMGGFVQNQEIQSGFVGGGGMSSAMTSYPSNFDTGLSTQMTTTNNNEFGQTWNQ